MVKRKIKIPIKGTQIFDMRKSRGYISIRNEKLKFYHKFKDEKSYVRWVETEKIEFAWGDTVYEIISQHIQR